MDLDALLPAIAHHFTGLHPKQRTALASLIIAVILTRTLTLAEMGRAVALEVPKQPRHLTKQLSRTLSNANLDVASLWRLWAVWLLASATEVVIAIDWTSLQNGQRRLLWAALCTDDGRAIPLMALSVATHRLKGRQAAMERRLLDRLRAVVPADVAVTITADRGFDGQPFRQHLIQHGFHFVIRVRSNLLVHRHGRAARVAALCPRRGRPPQSYETIELTAQRHAVPRLVTAFAVTAQEPLAVVTDLTLDATRVIAIYALRFQIEELFRDLKNDRLGLGLESLDMTDPGRLSRLLVAVSIGYTVVRRIGQLAVHERLDRQFSTRATHGKRHSTFSLGKYQARATPRLLGAAIDSLDSLGFAAAA
jgi:hypothetical protein